MKFSKKVIVLLLTFVMTFSIGLTGCKDKTPTPTPTPTPEVPAVTSVEITNTVNTLGAGDFAITAKCLPEKSNQEFSVKLDSKNMGVSLDGKNIKVHAGANSGETVKVTVSSVADPTKTASKSFTIAIGEIAYKTITTTDELIAIGLTDESMAMNYKLGGNITIDKQKTGGDATEREHAKWSPFLKPFTGLLDGAGYTIKDIDAFGGETDGVGFFTVNKGVIRNIGFESADYWMNMTANSGVIAGVNDGGIVNAYTNVPLATAGGTAGALVGANNGYITNCYALGAVVSNSITADKAGVVGSNTGVITGVVADKETTGLQYFIGSEIGQSDVAMNEKLLSSIAMQTTKTFKDMNWSANAWHYTNVYPMLKNAQFNEADIEKDITIISNQTIEMGDLVNGKIQLAATKSNAAFDAVSWKITNSPQIAGVTIDSTTGELTFTAAVSTTPGVYGALDGETINVKATLIDADISSSRSFTIRNDGYKTATGIVVTTEAELYDALFLKADKSNQKVYERNITRAIKLGGNITLADPATKSANKHYNWPGVKEFYGVFDGQGYAISGLKVHVGDGLTVTLDDGTFYNGNVGWGFFRQLGNAESNRAGTIKNLILDKGSVEISVMYANAPGRRSGGLVQDFECGLIKDVLVDLSMKSNSNAFGKIVGKMTGKNSIKQAYNKGTARIESTIAMGSMTTTLDRDYNPDADNSTSPRTWNPHAVGLFLGKAEQGSEIFNCYALGEASDDVNFSNRSVDNFKESVSGAKNYGIKTEDDLLKASTFEGHGFDSGIWYYADDHYPTLRYPGFTDDSQSVVPASIAITSKQNEIYYLPAITAGIQLTTKTINAKGEKPVFSVEPAVSGVAVSADGLVTVTDAIAKGESTIIIKVKLTTGKVETSTTFKVDNSGYDPAVGYEIASEEDLYNHFIVGGFSGTQKNADKVAKNLTRNVHLKNNIQLTQKKAWPSVAGTFSGSFNGNGYTISGIDVPDTVATDGYGFFTRIEAPTKTQISVEKLVLKGSINGKGAHVAGLVEDFSGGIIQNVLVDMNIQSNSVRAGKIVGCIGGPRATIQNSLAQGSIKTTSGDAVGDWNPYRVGAFLGYSNDTASYWIKNNIAIRAAGDNDSNVGFTIRKNNTHGENGSIENSEIVTLDQYLMAETYTGKKFDPAIWFFKNGFAPTLRNAEFDEGAVEAYPSVVKITTNSTAYGSNQAYDFKALPEGKIIITTELINGLNKTIEYSIPTPVNGVSIDSTGIITVTNAVTDNATVTVLAKINGTTATDDYTFTIYNDGYDPIKGIAVTDDASLYEKLFTASDVARNMYRKIVLSNDITLTTHANWPGVPTTFAGCLDGKGHKITGFNVSNATPTDDGYGFFRKIEAIEKDNVVIQNLIMEGKIDYTAKSVDSADHGCVGALAAEFKSGTIQNVLVNMTMTTNWRYFGKTVGHLTSNNAAMRNVIALGSIKTTLAYAEPKDGTVRPTWGKYALGGFMAKTEECGDFSNCFFMREAGDDEKDVGWSIRTGETDRHKDWIKTEAQLKVATMPEFDAEIWQFSTTAMPTLKVQK